jgi:hypothetical protein
VCSVILFQCQLILRNAIWCYSSKHGVACNPILHSQHLNFIYFLVSLAKHTWHWILFHCISQCLLCLVSSLFGLPVDGVCLLCLSPKMLTGEESLLMWGGSVCCNTLGHPVYLWTAGTVGQHFVLSAHCVKFVPLMLSELLSVSLSLWAKMSQSSDECASESDKNTSSMMSRFVKHSPYSHIAKVLWCSSAHNKPNTSDSVVQASALPALLYVIAFEWEQTEVFCSRYT